MPGPIPFGLQRSTALFHAAVSFFFFFFFYLVYQKQYRIYCQITKSTRWDVGMDALEMSEVENGDRGDEMRIIAEIKNNTCDTLRYITRGCVPECIIRYPVRGGGQYEPHTSTPVPVLSTVRPPTNCALKPRAREAMDEIVRKLTYHVP